VFSFDFVLWIEELLQNFLNPIISIYNGGSMVGPPNTDFSLVYSLIHPILDIDYLQINIDSIRK
jgi:hypothetical protein